MSRVLFTAVLCSFAIADAVAQQMTFQRGAINGVLLHSNGRHAAIYGWEDAELPVCDSIFLTHGRRDVVWKSESVVAAGARVIAAKGDRYLFESPKEFWQLFQKARFHDYGQQSTKVYGSAVAVDQWMTDGDVIQWQDIQLTVLETPGFTRGAVSLVATLDGVRTAFTGDLIYGDGQILDLYSFQDAIPEAQVRGYHGYGARLADLVSSLEKLRAAELELLVPARGPVIRNPKAAIDRLITRVRGLYHNYLSTNALHWYFKEDRMRTCGERILGKGASIDLMPYANHEQTPEWIFEKGTSRLLISESGGAFLLDCGNQSVIQTIRKLIDDDAIDRVEGIFVTHYHDDHTDSVQAAAEQFDCPVYATAEYADVLERPAAWHLPAMTANAIQNITVMKDGQQLKWHEFDLTFQFFPGQTYYHGALFVEKPGERPVYFVGDAFAPSGLDDYCVLNRNLVNEDSGYLYCLRMLRDVGKPFWIVNEHIPYVFEFSSQELDYLESQYRARGKIMAELFPWDAPDFGVDEQWAVMYPRSTEASAGAQIRMEIRLTNHSARPRSFRIRLNLPDGISAENDVAELNVAAQAGGHVHFPLQVGKVSGIHLLTADIASDGMEFRRWTDATVTVK